MTFKVESGIPVPTITRSHKHSIYPFESMRINDSFAVPIGDDERSKVEARIRTATLRAAKQMGVRFTVRFLEDTEEVRVWRVA